MASRTLPLRVVLLVALVIGITTTGSAMASAAPAPTGPTTADDKATAAMAYYQAAQQYWQPSGGVTPYSTCLPGDSCSSPPPANKTLAVTWQQQVKDYWCGPATMAMIVAYLGHGYSGSWYSQQSAAADELRTTVDGTDFGRMQPALNSRVHTTFYVNMKLPPTPSASQINYFKAELVYDVNYAKGWPLAANEDADRNSYLSGQHMIDGSTIMYWLTPIGYLNSGASTVYQDPGWGDPKLGPFNWPTSKFVIALGGRGYVY